MSKTEGLFWRDRRVLITGGTGLLGGWLVRALLRQSADVVMLVRDWVPQSAVLQSGEVERTTLVRGDVTDQALLERTLGEYEIQTVFHLAAQTLVPIANRNPVSTFETNIAGTWRLLEACHRTPTIESVIVASSDKAYGEGARLPYTEDMAMAGRHPYDVSKSCADLICGSYAETYGLPVGVIRCGNLFGGGDLNWNRIVPGTFRSIIRGDRPIVRSDGSPVRDYIYVEDAVSAYLLLAEKLTADKTLKGEAFNIAADKPLSVSEVIRDVLNTAGSTLEPDIKNEAHHEIQAQYLDSAKARHRLGWRPDVGLEEGLRRSLVWYRQLLE